MSNRNTYGILTNGDEDEDEVGSLHTILDNSINSSSNTVQARAEDAEGQQLDIEIAQGLKALSTDLKLVHQRSTKALSTIIDDEDFDLKGGDMTVQPTLEVSAEYKDKVEGVIVRADIDLFKDHLSNVLATASHPQHCGGCAHLLDYKARYCEWLGNNTATLPTTTIRPTKPTADKATTVLWKQYEQTKKVFDLETHCPDQCMKFIVKRYPVIMGRLKNKFDTLPLQLTLQDAFKHIFTNVTDAVDTREEYVKTHRMFLSLTFQASEEDGLSNYFEKITKLLRRMEVLDGGKEYDKATIVSQCQSVIRNLGINKRELGLIDKAWVLEDKNEPEETRFVRFKVYYIAETAILAADEAQPTTNYANSAMQQKIDDLSESLLQMQQDNSLLMANQEQLAAYKSGGGGVPTEITTTPSGDASVVPGSDLAALISKILDDRTQSTQQSSGSDSNKTVDRKLQPEVTWWQQFKFYCPSCGVNLNHGAKKCPKKKRMKNHDESVTWDKKETPQNKDRRDHLWQQWCEPVTMKVRKEKGEGEARWRRWRGIEVNKNISNDLTKKSILSRPTILPLPPLPSVVLLPFACPTLSTSNNEHQKRVHMIVGSETKYPLRTQR